MGTAKNARQGTLPEDLVDSCWDLLGEMEDILGSFEILHMDIGYALDDIRDGMERIRKYNADCSVALHALSRRLIRKSPGELPENIL